MPLEPTTGKILLHEHTAEDIPYVPGESVKQILDDTINAGVLDAITVSDAGTRNITWTAGEIFDHGNSEVVDTVSGSGTCDDNKVNYLIWVSGTGLTLQDTSIDPATDEVLIAHIICQENDIWQIHQNNIISRREYEMTEALGEMFPSIVTDGLIVSEDGVGENTWDVTMSAGTYYHDGSERHAIAAAVRSSVTAMVRWYKVAGVWTSDTNAEIDELKWLNGADLAVIADTGPAKYYRSSFFVVGSVIHWIYPQVQYNTIAQALAGGCPTMPPGFAREPRTTCLILKGTDLAFPASTSEQWIDSRPIVGSSQRTSTSDHGSLAGLGDDDHTQYVLHSLADSANDFLVASGNDAFVKKSLADTGTILEGDIDHDKIVNNHNLTTDISHDDITSGTIADHDTTGTGANLTELTDGSDTTLHDHDGISENTNARHTQGTDTALGTMAADIDMDGSYQVVGLQAPAASGEAIRQTVKITETNMEAAHDHVASDGSSHADVVTNSTHSAGDGSDHADVGTNTTAIGLNTTHRGSSGADHSYLDQAVTVAGTPQFAGVKIGAGTRDKPLHVEGATATLRLQDDANSASFSDFDDAAATQLKIEKTCLDGSINMFFNNFTLNETGNSSFGFGRNSLTTGSRTLRMYYGNNTSASAAQIGAVSSDTYFCVGGGDMGVNDSSPAEKLDVGGNVRADDYLEYSDLYTGDAISDIKNISKTADNSVDGWAEVDHDTLPDKVKVIVKEKRWFDKKANKEMGKNFDPTLIDKNDKKVYKESDYEKREYDKECRSVPKGVQLNLRAIKQLIEKVESLEAQLAAKD